MNMLLRNLFHLHRLMDEVTEGTGGGGGDTPNLTVDIEAASDAIGADLGLNEGEGTDDLLDGSATPPEGGKKESLPNDDAGKLAREKAAAAVKTAAEAKTALDAARKLLAEKKVDLTGKTDAQILELAKPPVKNLPKAWKQEHKATWEKLPVEAQAYIEQREAEVEAGFKSYGELSTYGKALKEVMQPYEALLTAQGVQDHGHAIKAVMNAHFVLSTKTPDEKARFMAQLAKNYQVDGAKVAEYFAAAASGGLQETASEKANRERIDRLENERNTERKTAFDALKAQSANEVAAFAADPKHPHFSEVAREVALLLQDPQLSLEQAYERAVYANPVTREKELARLRQEAEEKTRTEAEAKAKAAEKARGTKVRGKEEERGSPDLVGSMEDTMRETLGKIKGRQEA